MPSKWTSLAALVVSPLAVYRLSSMIAREEGPFEVFIKWRDYVGQSSWIGRGFHCPLCVSVWAAFFVVWLLQSGAGQNAVLALGLSGATTYIVNAGK